MFIRRQFNVILFLHIIMEVKVLIFNLILFFVNFFLSNLIFFAQFLSYTQFAQLATSLYCFVLDVLIGKLLYKNNKT